MQTAVTDLGIEGDYEREAGPVPHAMSPIGGVGINLAIQDAVAAANILAEPLRAQGATRETLEAVQRRRGFPTRVAQQIQLVMQKTVVTRALEETDSFEPPLAVRLLAKLPWLRRIPARVLGMGVRPEHVHTRARAPRAASSEAS